MKNVYKLLGIAALALAMVFSFAACNNSTSSGGGGGSGSGSGGGTGGLKITGIPTTYEGKYIYGVATSPQFIMAGVDKLDPEKINAKIAANGTATLDVWDILGATSSGYPAYAGNDTFTTFTFGVFQNPTNNTSMSSAIKGFQGPVTFTDGGKATIDVSDTNIWYWY
jgi:hypothetical protein